MPNPQHTFPRPLLLAALLPVLLATASVVNAAPIDSTDKYAWSETSGWLNFAATGGNVSVLPDHIEGYVWADNTGWLRLGTHTSGGEHTYTNNSATSYGINRATDGTLSGYAWSENAGWVNFGATAGNATVANDGSFSGYAWADNLGWINLAGTAGNGTAYQVKSGALLTNAPTLQPTNGKTLSGTGTAGATLTVKDSAGNIVCTPTVGNDGNWSCTGLSLANGAQVTAQQGTESSTTVTVDNIPPATPTLNPSNGGSISGTGEPGATIAVKDSNGTTVCTATVDSEGNWHCTPAATVTDGTTLSVIQTDASGNPSPAVSGKVDITLPGLNLSGNHTAIAHNDNTPSVADGTDFGSLDVTNGEKIHELTVINKGTAVVTLALRLDETDGAGTGITPERLLARLNPISTADAAGATDFTLNPSSLTIPAGGSATFNITFNPTQAGTRQARVVLSRAGVDAFSFMVSGTGTGGSTTTVAPANIPVFGPFGLLAMLFGLFWFGRRRKH